MQWRLGEAQNASEIVMVADGNAQFTDAMGLTLTQLGSQARSQRYAMLVDDGVLPISMLKKGPVWKQALQKP